MGIKIDLRNMRSELDQDMVNQGLEMVTGLENRKDLGFLRLPDTDEYIEECRTILERIPDDHDIVVLGIGGSALGTSMVLSALPDHKNNIHVVDNVDPESIFSLTQSLNPEKTLLNIVSKSGGTVEPAALFQYFFNFLKGALGEKKAFEKCIITTDSQKGVLRQLADEKNLLSLSVPSDVGGRFSVLTPVSLFPLMAAGVDVDVILQGALMEKKEGAERAVTGAVIDVYQSHYNRNIKVLFPYSDKLFMFGQWYLQLFGESLGKAVDRKGCQVNTGQTAVLVKGVTDQHSQLQLYAEGPDDKYVSFFKVLGKRSLDIPEVFTEYDPFSYLGGKTFNQLMDAEYEGTISSLEENGVPVFSYNLDRLDSETLGRLIYMFELQTAVTGEFLNIDAFNQPGVEAGKIIAKRLLNEPKTQMEG